MAKQTILIIAAVVVVAIVIFASTYLIMKRSSSRVDPTSGPRVDPTSGLKIQITSGDKKGKYLVLEQGMPANITDDPSKATTISLEISKVDASGKITGTGTVGDRVIKTADGKYYIGINEKVPGVSNIQESVDSDGEPTNIVTYDTVFQNITGMADLYIPNQQNVIAAQFGGYNFLWVDANGLFWAPAQWEPAQAAYIAPDGTPTFVAVIA